MFLIDSSNCKGSNYFFYLQIKLFQSILFIFQISDNPHYDNQYVFTEYSEAVEPRF